MASACADLHWGSRSLEASALKTISLDVVDMRLACQLPEQITRFCTNVPKTILKSAHHQPFCCLEKVDDTFLHSVHRYQPLLSITSGAKQAQSGCCQLLVVLAVPVAPVLAHAASVRTLRATARRFLCGFSHIFAGGYAAGYYSYKWAETLSADAFAAFEEAGLADEKAKFSIGRKFRDTILALGGGRAPELVFRVSPATRLSQI